MSERVNDASARAWDRAVPGAEVPEPVETMASAHAGSPEVEEASATGGIGDAS